MTTIVLEVPDNKKKAISTLVKKEGAKVVSSTDVKTDKNSDDEDDEVTHGEYFFENIKRVIKAFKK